jgi:hypothetical protein
MILNIRGRRLKFDRMYVRAGGRLLILLTEERRLVNNVELIQESVSAIILECKCGYHKILELGWEAVG